MKKILCALLGMLLAGTSWSATLPAGYTELEYIESSGDGQYFDTGIAAKNGLDVAAKFEFNTNRTTSLMGTRYQFQARFWPVAAVYVQDAFKWDATINGDTPAGTVESNRVYTTYFTSDANGWKFSVDGTQISGRSDVWSQSGNMWLFATNNSGEVQYPFKGKVYYVKIYDNGSIVRDFVPAKNSSGVIGMYDTVNNEFYTNQGTGEFIAGPVVPENIYSQKFAGYIDGYFKSADNNRVIRSYDGNSILILNTEIGKTYTLKNTKTLMNASNGTRIYSSNVMPVVGTIYTPDQFYTVTDATTWVEGVTFTAKDIYTALLVRGDADNSANHDFAYIAEGLELYEIYQAPIKIATTAYNSARFSPVVTELNDTIATIRSVVTNTINQTNAIADLQATKQTRPDENCPAGKKCLLVEDNDGQPHWYEIIESPVVQ